MEESLQTGLSMLLIGMTTVFFILFFLVAGGNILIRLVNRFYPEETDQARKVTQGIDKNKIAAIIAIVEMITVGKGKIENVKKSIRN